MIETIASFLSLDYVIALLSHFFLLLSLYLCSLARPNMSVLVSSVLSAHVYSNTRRTSGNVVVSAFEQMPLNMENDQVPSGVVNSMKQRLLDKFSESLVVNTRPSGSKSSNFSSLKHTTRLSRSQDSLLNDHSESLATFLQPKQNVIIVDTTVIKDEHIRQPRSAHSELHVDEVPKPGR